ncbi:unnamed protein product [Pleuronectes platessa]|uniref:Uncharacterized protein n=1 Tax=Pleuronectes platessa TaxID=8262 RepID=A0A9N7UP46_PLEPL|nr:unnamed protein product [Pleuronectes platessa]
MGKCRGLIPVPVPSAASHFRPSPGSQSQMVERTREDSPRRLMSPLSTALVSLGGAEVVEFGTVGELINESLGCPRVQDDVQPGEISTVSIIQGVIEVCRERDNEGHDVVLVEDVLFWRTDRRRVI